MAATTATMGATVMVFLVTILLLDTAGAEGVSVAGAGGGQCEEIQIPMCKEIGYNFTRLPNQFNHESQDEVSNNQNHSDLQFMPTTQNGMNRLGEEGTNICF